jgi:hypothetical protein
LRKSRTARSNICSSAPSGLLKPEHGRACRRIASAAPCASSKRQGVVITEIIFAGILRYFGKGIILFVFSDHSGGALRPPP